MSNNSRFAGWPLYGGKPINQKLVKPLNKMAAQYPTTNAMMKRRLTQAAGFVKASEGTHSEGYALDFTSRGLSEKTIRNIVDALHYGGFAVVLRLAGEVSRGEHIHAALYPYSNSVDVANATKPGAHQDLDRKLRMRRERLAK